jgi:hypothetical protein
MLLASSDCGVMILVFEERKRVGGRSELKVNASDQTKTVRQAEAATARWSQELERFLVLDPFG